MPQPITNSPPKWMAELESEDIEMLKGNVQNILNLLYWTSYSVPATAGVKQED